MNSLAEQVLAAARAKGWRLATAESCTGGMVASALTDIAGSSDVFECGFVTYSNEAKLAFLRVREATLEAHGAVSEEVAIQMAASAQHAGNVEIAVATTGIAGPGGSDHKPEGRVCFGLTAMGIVPITETVEFGPLGRGQVRERATEHALQMILKVLVE